MPVTDASFGKVVSNADVPVVVDFYADWCGPCKMMAPALDDFAREQMGRVLVSRSSPRATPSMRPLRQRPQPEPA
jgi:thioredoxin 1